MANLMVLVTLLVSLCALSLCCSYGDLRLRDGPNNFEGRMEVCNANGVWGGVCHDNLDHDGDKGRAASTVACRQLGFSDQGAILVRGAREAFHPTYAPGMGEIHLDELICTGNEGALVDCGHSGIGADTTCDEYDHAGVICMPSNCTNGELRLVDRGAETEGRVEMCLNQTWFTLSGTGWGAEEASVVCTQLEMSAQGASPASASAGVGPILSADCTGQESSLSSCALSNGGHNYNHTNDARVSCSGGSSQSTTTPPVSTEQVATSTEQTTTQQTAVTETTTVLTQPATTTEDTITVQSSTTDTVTTSRHNHTTSSTAAQTTLSSTNTERETTASIDSTLNNTDMPSSTSESGSVTMDTETTTAVTDNAAGTGQLWAIVATAVLGFAVIVLVVLSIMCVCYSVKKRRNERFLQQSLRRTRSIDYVDQSPGTNTLQINLRHCDAYESPTNLNNSPKPTAQSPLYSSIGKRSNSDTDSGIMLHNCSAYGNNAQQQTNDELQYDYIHDYDYIYTNVDPKTGNMI